jgi:glycosyltransferase involved in cell wall biosynthesis
MNVTYLALGSRRDDNNAGFTHPFSVSRALSRRIGVSLLISGDVPGVMREHDPRIVELTLPASTRRFPNPVHVAKSALLARREAKGCRIVHERFRYNPVELAFPGRDGGYVLEINDVAGIGLRGPLGSLRRSILRRKLSRCDAVVTQTETLRRYLERMTDRPVHVVQNGVDTELFTPVRATSFRPEFGIGEEESVVLYVGSFRPWHGMSMIIEAARSLAGPGRGVRFVLVGTGPHYERSVRLAAGIGGVVFAGSVSPDRVPSFIAGADVCVAPFSSGDFGPIEDHGFWWCPVKLYEYMSCGKPVVTVDYPEVRGIVGDAALLAPPDDPGQFVKNIDTLLRDASLRRELGTAGRERCVRDHSWDLRAEALHEVYRSI